MSIFLIGTNAPDIGIDDRLSWVWRSDAYQNLIIIACLVGAGWLLRYASQQAVLAQRRKRQIRRKPTRYCLSFRSLRDTSLSVGWIASVGVTRSSDRPTKHSPEMRDGDIVYRPRGLSLLDRLCTPLRERTEKTYSAPFATHLYAKSTLQTPDGRTVRDYPPLQYPRSHLLGTDKVGNDVLYRALKGIRTGLVIGGFTTLIAVPFAIFFGVIAGYFGGWVDDAVQYIYATLDSIPSILLIVAFMLLFGQGLFNLCLIMGIRSWTGPVSYPTR